jgi:hypothetical protein
MTPLPWAVRSVYEFNTSRITQILRYLLVKLSTHSTWTQLSSSVACAIISYFHINGTVDVNSSLPVLYLNQISCDRKPIILFVESYSDVIMKDEEFTCDDCLNDGWTLFYFLVIATFSFDNCFTCFAQVLL